MEAPGRKDLAAGRHPQTSDSDGGAAIPPAQMAIPMAPADLRDRPPACDVRVVRDEVAMDR
jgi:hypothetical protein